MNGTSGGQPGTGVEERKAPPGYGDHGMVVFAYLLAGIGLYGGLGWLADRQWGLVWGLPVGVIVGFAVSMFIIFKRYGSDA